MRERNVLLFDGDCGFCTTCVAFIERRIRPDAEILPHQWQDLASYGTTADRAADEILWITPSGEILGGARAVAAMLRSSPAPWRPLGRLLTLPPLTWAAHAAYRITARNRHRLPGGTPACALPPRKAP
ncbi:thiol-disulfide oxidoreductase DCC family protein [Actinocorallia aurea]